MINGEVNTANNPALIKAYALAAQRHGEASRNADYKAANQQYEIMATICRELRARGRDAQLGLIELLNYTNFDVRLWAATHSLEFAPELGEPVLTELSNSGDLAGFDAKMTLSEWRKGTLRFP